jgi:hypothetical protein
VIVKQQSKKYDPVGYLHHITLNYAMNDLWP